MCSQLTAVEDFLVKYTRNGVLARMGRAAEMRPENLNRVIPAEEGR